MRRIGGDEEPYVARIAREYRRREKAHRFGDYNRVDRVCGSCRPEQCPGMPGETWRDRGLLTYTPERPVDGCIACSTSNCLGDYNGGNDDHEFLAVRVSNDRAGKSIAVCPGEQSARIENQPPSQLPFRHYLGHSIVAAQRSTSSGIGPYFAANSSSASRKRSP